jgi:hypothetical protein
VAKQARQRARIYCRDDGRRIENVAGQHLPDIAEQSTSSEFSLLLIGVMAIADEVDSQLAQAMVAYVDKSNVDAMPLLA